MRISSALIIGIILASAVSAQSGYPSYPSQTEQQPVCNGLLNAPLFSRDDPRWSYLRNSQGIVLSQATHAIASALNAIGAHFSGQQVTPAIFNNWLVSIRGYDINSQPRFDLLPSLGLSYVRQASNPEDAAKAVCAGFVVIISSQAPNGVWNWGPVVRWGVEQGYSTFYTPGPYRISAAFIRQAWIFRRL